MHANKMRLNKLNDSVLTVNYTVERKKNAHTEKEMQRGKTRRKQRTEQKTKRKGKKEKQMNMI